MEIAEAIGELISGLLELAFFSMKAAVITIILLILSVIVVVSLHSCSPVPVPAVKQNTEKVLTPS